MYLLKHAMSVPPSEMAQRVEEDQPPAGEALNIDDTSLGIVLSLVGLHLPCRDLIRLQVVSREWRKWCTEIAPSLWEARKRDNVPDWYFPTGLVRHDESLLSPRHWYGIHHPSAECHRLPGLEFLELGPNWRVEVLTGAGGLLLLYAECEINIRETRLVESEMCEEEVKDIGAEDRVSRKRLIVCNPLTKRWRALSELDQSIPVELKHLYPALLRFAKRPVYDYDEVTCPSKENTCVVAIHMMVNNESGSYEIVIIWVTRTTPKNYLVEVYDSEMDRWEANTSPMHNEFTLGSVCLNHRIYLLEQVGELHVVARVFLVDSRTWLPTDYTLFDEEMYIGAYSGGHRRSRTGPCLTVVACSSGIYAFVPMREDFNAHHGSYCWPGWCIKHRRICCLGLNFEGNVRFDLFKLQEQQNQVAFRQVLFFKVRMNFGEPQVRWHVGALGPDNLPCRGCTWYRCASKGSVIWLACGDLLLQFDMVTRRCKARTVHCDEFTGFETMGENRENFMPYEPSFCAEP